MGREIVAEYQGVKRTRWMIEALNELGIWMLVGETHFDEDSAKKVAGDAADELETNVRVVKVTP